MIKVEFAGTNQVSKEKIIETLQKILQNGDPILEFDFYSGADDIFKFATKASLLIKSLNNDTCCMFQGSVPQFKPRSGTLNKLRWWLLPLIFTVLSWAILLQP